METKNILVLGASGIQICKVLEQKQLKHRALVRPGSGAKISTPSTEIITGDALIASDVKKALNQSSYTDIINALGSKDLKSYDVRSKGTENVLKALEQNSSACALHVISAHGTGESWKELNGFEKFITKIFLKKTMQDHNAQEAVLKQYKGPIHLIRPVALKNNAPTGRVASSRDGQLPHSDISRADLAKYIVDSLLEGKYLTESLSRG